MCVNNNKEKEAIHVRVRVAWKDVEGGHFSGDEGRKRKERK